MVKRGGGCKCKGLDWTQNHLKLEKKTKKKKKSEKNCGPSGIRTHDPQITDPALNPIG